MSAADRVVLLILMAFVATSVMRSETAVKVAGLPGPVHRDEAGHGAVPELPGKAVSNPSAKTPASSVIEPTVVTVMERPMEEASASIGQTLAPPSPVALARELQKELKRVGCYAGKPNGVWSASTRRAMKAFSDRVNAKLPIDKPDSILLALVQSQPNKVCGEPCASGHELNQTQPCTWNGLLAGSSRTKFSAAPGQQATSEWTVKTAVPGTAKVPQGWLEPASPSSKFVGPPMQKRAPPRVARHWRAHPKHERAWVANFFRQRDRFSVY